MSDTTPLAAAANSAPTEVSNRLRGGTLGVTGMVFLVVAAAAPLTAVASNLSLSIGIGAGVGTLGWIVVIGALLLVFSVGYVALSRCVVSAGAYHAYVEYGLGRSAGSAIAFIADVAYCMASAGMVVAFGVFADLTISVYIGADLHWAVYSVLGLILVALLGHFGADFASLVTTIVSLAQFALLLVLAVAVLVQNPGGFTLDGFTPHAMFEGGFALTAVFVLLLFGGYEAAAAHGEEAKAPIRNVRRATFIALSLLLVVFVMATWTLIGAFDDVVAIAAADPGALLNTVATTYLGPGMGAVMSVVVTFSFLAAAVAFHNMATRYTFSLARARMLPYVLSRTTHRRSVPAISSAVHIVIIILIIAPFIIAGADPLTGLFPAISGVTSLALIVMTVTCSISALVSALRGRLPGSRRATRIAPAFAAVGLAALGVIIVVNYPQVTGSDSPVIALMPLLLVAAATTAVVISRVRRQTAPAAAPTATLEERTR